MSAELQRAEAFTRLTSCGSPYELSLADVRGVSRRVFRCSPRCLAEIVADARSFGDAPFLVFEDDRLTYAQVHENVERLAGCLWQLGVRTHDRVAIAMRNYPEWVLAFLAVARIGAVAVALNCWWSRADTIRIARSCDLKLAFTDPERFTILRDALTDGNVPIVTVRAADDSGISFDDLVHKRTSTAAPWPVVGLDDPACILFTSGSAGSAKGVVSSQRAILHALLAVELNYLVDNRIDPADIADRAGWLAAQARRPGDTLLPIPLFHVNGLILGMLRAYRGGKKLVLMRKWDAREAVDLIDREAIALFPGVPTVTRDLVEAAAAGGRSMPTLRLVGGGGAARSPQQRAALARIHPQIIAFSGWGMTETNALGTAISGERYAARPTSAGQALAGVELEVVDEAGNALPAGSRGELLVRTAALFTEYWKDPQATQHAFVHGWFRTGDVGYIHADGFLHIVDRLKSIIIRGGENIGCIEIEHALQSHPAVAEAVVVSVPDERLGEEIGAVVALHPQRSVAVDEIKAHLRGVLSANQVPRYIWVRGHSLPRLGVEKFDRQKCRAELLHYLAAREHA